MKIIEELPGTAARLVEALEGGQFALLCQPIVPVSSGQVDHKFLELFVRFREEEDKLIPPGSFFDVLEHSHLLPTLDRWVVGDALGWVRSRLDAMPNWHVPRLSINLAGDTVRDSEFPIFVREHLKVWRIPAEKLCFELVADDANKLSSEARRAASTLKSLGCSTVISGYSGGAAAAKQCQDAGIRFVKLDRATVWSAQKDQAALARLIEINNACQSRGLHTIAEFVEDASMLALLRRVGVNYAQGFGIAVPVPLKTLA